MATFKYETLAREIEEAIQAGIHPPGAKLQSVRELRAATGASLATVQKAYLLLEQRGVIETRPNAGHFVRHLHAIREDGPEPAGSSAQLIDSLVIRSFIRATQDPNFVQLTEAMPSTETLPIKAIQRSMRRAMREHEEQLCSFTDPQGLPELRQKIAQIMGLSLGGVSPDEVVITNGGMESWNLCLRAVTQPGDRVLVQPAVYFGVLEILESLGLSWSVIPGAAGVIDLSALEQLVRSQQFAACFLIPNFVGVSGQPIAEECKPDLVRLLQRQRIPIIEDDVYGDMYFGIKRPAKLRAHHRDVIHCGSFSKSIAPGFRCAWIAAGRHLDAILRQKFITSISSPTITQLIVADFLNRSSYERQLRTLRRDLPQRLSDYHTIIKRWFPKETRVIRPPIGSSLWVELPAGVDSVALYLRALEKNVALAPGPIHSASGDLRQYLRLSFARSMTPQIENAIRSVAESAEEIRASNAAVTIRDQDAFGSGRTRSDRRDLGGGVPLARKRTGEDRPG